MPVIRPYQQQVGPGVSVAQPRGTPAAFGAEFADAVGDVERFAMGEIERGRQRDREDARAQAGVELAQLSGATGESITKLRETAGPGGDGHQAAVLADYDARASAVRARINDPETARWAEVQIAQDRARFQMQEGGWEAGRRVDRLLSDVATATDIDRTTLYANPSAEFLRIAVERSDGVVAALSIDDATKTKLRAENRAGLSLSFIQGLRERDPYKAREMLESGALAGAIDPDRMMALRNGVDAEIRGREVAARQEQRERERAARDAERDRRDAERDYRQLVNDNVRALDERLAAGEPVSAQEISAAVTEAARVGNTELARRTATLGIKSLTIQGLRGQPPVAVQTYINELSAKISSGNASTEDRHARDAAVDYLAMSKRELAADPLSFGAREGVAQVQPLDPANPASYAQRVAAAKTVSRRYGTPMAVLTDEEAAAVAGQINGSPQAAVETITSLRAFGKEGAFAVARQIAPKDPAAAHVVGLSLLPRGAGAKNAADVQTGRSLLASNPKIIDTKRAAAARAEALGDSLRLIPQLANVIPDISDALYAARWTRAGGEGFDPKAYRTVIGAALGGYTDFNGVARGGIGTDRSGEPTWLPTGVSQDEFDNAIEALDDAKLAANPAAKPVDARGRPVPAATIKRGRLLPIGDGRYKVQVGGGFIGAANGGHFVLNMRNPAMPQ